MIHNLIKLWIKCWINHIKIKRGKERDRWTLLNSQPSRPSLFFCRLISEEEFSVDLDLLLKSRCVPTSQSLSSDLATAIGRVVTWIFVSSKNVDHSLSVVHRDLNARVRSAEFQMEFNLPKEEKLDGTIACALYTPFNHRFNMGTLYISANFLCFSSKVSFVHRRGNRSRKKWISSITLAMLWPVGPFHSRFISWLFRFFTKNWALDELKVPFFQSLILTDVCSETGKVSFDGK